MRFNYKKGIAGVLTVVLAMCTVSITDVRASNAGGAGGTGGMEGLVGEVFNVVVPTQPDQSITENKVYTNSPLNFILDPKRITPPALPDKTFEDNASIFFKNQEAGSLYDYSSTSDGFTVINKSTTKVDITLNATLEGMDGVKLTNGSAFTDDKSASVYLALIDSNKRAAAIDKFGAVIKATLEGRPEAYKVTYNSLTGKYKREMKSDSEIAAEGITFENYVFRMTGACNMANSWSSLSGTIEPAITITWTVALRPKKVAPSIPKDSYVMNEGNPLSIGVDLGSGELEAKGIKEITFVNSNGVTKTVSTSDYSLVNNELIFTASYIDLLIGNGVQSRSFTVTFNDTAQTKKKVTLVTNDTAPSIDQTEYIMASNQPIQINVDLGSGTLAATGIQSITFINPTGQTKTLPATDYTFKDNVLEVNSAYINSLLSNGVTSRVHTITLNDPAKTQVKVTFAANGNGPSIADKEYIMKKGEEVEVSVDLGTDDLAATGVAEVTFVNGAGVKKVLPTSDYTFADSKLTFSSDYILSLFNGGVTSRTFTITFNDGAKTQISVLLTAEDTKPSNVDGEYAMHIDQPIQINVDLGSGASGATGIASITFVNGAGVTKTLPTSDYMFADGVLKVSASYINSLLNNGVISRIHTITLNDAAKTQIKATFIVNGNEPSINQKDFIMQRGQGVEVNVDLGTDDLEASGITEITFVNAAGVKRTLPTSEYTFANNTLKFSESYILSLFNGGVMSRTFTIVFNNSVKTQVSVTLAAENKKPSNVDSEHAMHLNQPIQINVDLGSGALGATGIASITFVNAAGVTKTLPTTDYTFTNGVLKINASYINSLLNNGVTSRVHTVTLNDTAKTQLKATFVVNGTKPSIENKTYMMQKGQGLEMNVNLGTDDLAATGITEITFINGAGVKRTLPASDYTLANNKLKFSESYILSLLNGGVNSRDFTIIFNNAGKTQASVTLTAVSIAPSIKQTEYKMVSGQSLPIDIDWGSGDARATGINSLTYNDGGKETVVPSSYYFLENGVLKLRASYINGVLSANILTREYKIIFNDKAQTQGTIILKK